MPCNTLIEPACRAAGQRDPVGDQQRQPGTCSAGSPRRSPPGSSGSSTNTATWWLQIPSPDLAAEPAVTRIQQWLLPITAAVAVGGVIAAGARMALTRRANPLLDVTGGLLTLAAASTLGRHGHRRCCSRPETPGRRGCCRSPPAGTSPSGWTWLLNLGGGAAPAVVLVFGSIAIVLSLVQAVLMLFRQAALIILAGVLPLAAAGSIAPMTRAWVRKVTAWMLALICYKPAAAAVYATAFTMVGSGGSPRTALMGFVMLLLSVLMLPALMKFFTWTTGTIASSGGGGATARRRHRRRDRDRRHAAPPAPGPRRTRPPTSTPGSALRPAVRPGAPPGGPASGPNGRRARAGRWPRWRVVGRAGPPPAWSSAGSGGAGHRRRSRHQSR